MRKVRREKRELRAIDREKGRDAERYKEGKRERQKRCADLDVHEHVA